jgi:hypothetical protein
MKDRTNKATCGDCLHGDVCAWRAETQRKINGFWDDFWGDNKNDPIVPDKKYKVTEHINAELQTACDTILGGRCQFYVCSE